MPWSRLFLVAGATATSLLPSFLIGSLVPAIRQDFPLSDAQLGLVVMVNLGASALASVPMGRLSERIGATRALRLALASTAVAVFGVAWLASSWQSLAVWSLLSGLGVAGVYPSTNLAIARQIPFRRQGFTFGVKQAAVPTATMIGGLAVPLVEAVAGWRAAFVGTGLLAIALLIISGKLLGESRASVGERPTFRPRMIPLLVLAVGVGLAGGAVQPLGTFAVSYGVEIGLEPSAAATALAVASLLGITVRVCAGAATDRRPKVDLFRVLATFLVVGAAAMLVLSTATGMLVFTGALLIGVAIGWGWNGLFHFAVVSAHPDHPASASSVTQSGLLAGGALTPLVFGAVAENISFQLAWLGCAVSMLVGGGLLLLGGRLLRSSPNRPGGAAL